MIDELYKPIHSIKGVGLKRAELYNKVGIFCVRDILNYYPRSYINFKDTKDVIDTELNMNNAIKAFVKKKSIIKSYPTFISKIVVADKTDSIIITIFNRKFLHNNLQVGKEYIFYGKILGNFIEKNMANPNVLNIDSKFLIKPIYPIIKGITSNIIEKDVKSALYIFNSFFKNDVISEKIKISQKICDYDFAINKIHFPDNMEDIKIARRRLIFDELFYFQLSLSMLKKKTKIKTNLTQLDSEKFLEEFFSNIPFKATHDQLKAINECIFDIKSGYAMNRLIQGDVGCGKTLVSVALSYVLSKNKIQTCLMAPTEILAYQHYDTFKNMLELYCLNISVLTSSTSKSKRADILERLKNGDIDIIIGTHSLINDEVIFKNLGLVIMDEQHRFGVKQRVNLIKKCAYPNSLIMSATPIPRTLALILYSDLEISIIKEMPAGKKPIQTFAIQPFKKERMFNFLKSILDKGYQGYIVCPAISNYENEDSNLESVIDYSEKISKSFFKNYSIGVLHGKLKSSEKDKIMVDFKNKKYDILVSTSVIEVGIDVKNAVFIVIEDADRFGLSALHQLRGRVGRNNIQSYCLLVYKNSSDKTVKRLKIMCDSSDGFYISQKDLDLRGPGDFFGSKQHGLPNLKIANLVDDFSFVKDISKLADKVLQEDENLTLEENKNIKYEVDKFLSNDITLN